MTDNIPLIDYAEHNNAAVRNLLAYLNMHEVIWQTAYLLVGSFVDQTHAAAQGNGQTDIFDCRTITAEWIEGADGLESRLRRQLLSTLLLGEWIGGAEPQEGENDG